MVELKLRILFDPAMIGPGKADLLEQVRATGSIAAAGRQMAMSYKRDWMLVEDLNAAFSTALVASGRDGQGGGGAHLKEAGVQVLYLYQGVLNTSAGAEATPLQALKAMLPRQAGIERSNGNQCSSLLIAD